MRRLLHGNRLALAVFAIIIVIATINRPAIAPRSLLSWAVWVGVFLPPAIGAAIGLVALPRRWPATFRGARLLSGAVGGTIGAWCNPIGLMTILMSLADDTSRWHLAGLAMAVMLSALGWVVGVVVGALVGGASSLGRLLVKSARPPAR